MGPSLLVLQVARHHHHLCEREDGHEDKECVEMTARANRIFDGEDKCRRDSGLSEEQLRESLCTLPSDPEIREKVGKYSFCSMLNSGQMLPNGTIVEGPPMDCSPEALAATDAPTAAATATSEDADDDDDDEEVGARQPRQPTQKERRAVCSVKAAILGCVQDKEDEVGSSPEQRAMAHRLCMCQLFGHKETSRQ
ncbi:hypothetical protein R5R35_009010 [Gryllus longicercus]|uniref:Uncharacterized protein n=1 Tax=Gryllus longicercus TaxID=2509291 RepID=A0AAN9VCW0_9ORTH